MAAGPRLLQEDALLDLALDTLARTRTQKLLLFFATSSSPLFSGVEVFSSLTDSPVTSLESSLGPCIAYALPVIPSVPQSPVSSSLDSLDDLVLPIS